MPTNKIKKKKEYILNRWYIEYPWIYNKQNKTKWQSKLVVNSSPK